VSKVCLLLNLIAWIAYELCETIVISSRLEVWDIENSLNIYKQDESVPIMSNSGSYLSDYTSESQTNLSNTSSDNIVKVEEVDAGLR